MRALLFIVCASCILIGLVSHTSLADEHAGDHAISNSHQDTGLSESGYGGDSIDLGEEDDDEAKDHKPVKRRKIFKGFGSYRSRLGELCRLFDKDGQREWYAEMAKEAARYERDCKQCRALYVVISSTCPAAPKKKIPTVAATGAEDEEHAEEGAEEAHKGTPESDQIEAEDAKDPEHGEVDAKEKGGEAQEESSPEETLRPTLKLQFFEPSLQTVDAIFELARAMAQDEDMVEDNLVAIKQLTAKMKDPQGKSKASIAYFDATATFILEPFRARGYLATAKKEGSADTEKSQRPSQEEVDKLFQF